MQQQKDKEEEEEDIETILQSPQQLTVKQKRFDKKRQLEIERKEYRKSDKQQRQKLLDKIEKNKQRQITVKQTIKLSSQEQLNKQIEDALYKSKSCMYKPPLQRKTMRPYLSRNWIFTIEYLPHYPIPISEQQFKAIITLIYQTVYLNGQLRTIGYIQFKASQRQDYCEKIIPIAQFQPRVLSHKETVAMCSDPLNRVENSYYVYFKTVNQYIPKIN